MATFHRAVAGLTGVCALLNASDVTAACAQTPARARADSGCTACGGGQGWNGPQFNVTTTAIGNSSSVGLGDGGGTVSVNQTSGPVIVYQSHGGVGGGGGVSGYGTGSGLGGGLVNVGANGAASGNTLSTGGVSTGSLGTGAIASGSSGVSGLSNSGGLVNVGSSPSGALVTVATPVNTGTASSGTAGLGGASNAVAGLPATLGAATGALGSGGLNTVVSTIPNPVGGGGGVGVGVGVGVGGTSSAGVVGPVAQPMTGSSSSGAGALQLCPACIGALNGGVG